MNDVKPEFEEKISRLTESKAYLDYCEVVYGHRMYLFNMLDIEQLNFIFNEIPLSSDDTVLDLGCGSGSILNALISKRGCRGIGVDLLSDSAVKINRAKAQYVKCDIDDFEKLNITPTVTLLVDSIYFSRDAQALLCDLCRLKNNRIYLFYSQYLFDGHVADKSTLCGDYTPVAEALKKIRVTYKTIEYSENERTLYEQSLCALERLKDDFIREGNADLYEEKLKEQLLGKQLYDLGSASRYLYIVDGASVIHE